MRNELKNRLGQLHQRRKARESLQLLPEELRIGIDLDRIFYKEDIYANHQQELFPKDVDGKYVNPEGYSLYKYFEFDQLEHLADSIKKSCLVFEKECFVSLGSESGYWPIKKEQMDSLIDHYLKLLKSKCQSLTVFQSDFRKGMVVDDYCGYLPKNSITNAPEVVYEFIYWEKI